MCKSSSCSGAGAVKEAINATGVVLNAHAQIYRPNSLVRYPPLPLARNRESREEAAWFNPAFVMRETKTTTLAMWHMKTEHPYLLGMVEMHVATKHVWPGQSISAGEEATAAKDVFAIGDQPRFLVFATEGLAIPTVAFSIDEHPAMSNVPYRARH